MKTHDERTGCAVFDKLGGDESVGQQAPEEGGDKTGVEGREHNKRCCALFKE